MQIKKRRILIGIICIIMCFLFANYFQFISLPFLLLGITFLFLYKEKKKTWALFCGSIIIIICLGNLFFRIPSMGRNIFRTILLLFVSMLLFYSYRQSKNENFLVPASFLLWAGIYVLVICFPGFEANACAMLFICIGMAFFTVWFLKKKKEIIWPVILSTILFVLGFLFMRNNKITYFPIYIISLLLLFCSTVVLIKTIIKKF